MGALKPEVVAAANFKAKNLARICGYSTRQFRRIFREAAGCHPQKWLNSLRLEKAREDMLKGLPIKQVAFDVGFYDSSSFSRWFKHWTGVRPTDYAVFETKNRQL